MHPVNNKVISINKPLSRIFKCGDEDTAVLNVEILFTFFIDESNLPIACYSYAGPLFKKMFTNHNIATKHGCSRTKTGAALRSLSHGTQNNIAQEMKGFPFSLATDGNTDFKDIEIYF